MRLSIGAAAILGLSLQFAVMGISTASAAPSVKPAAATPAKPGAAAAAKPAAAGAAPVAAGLVALSVKDATGKTLSGNPVTGKKIFAQCATCHSPEKGKNVVGPSLYGIIGRKSGTIPGFRYSPANLKSNITWSEQELFNYLQDPQKRIPGTIMAFVGLKNAQQRADVISYLKTNAAAK